MPIEKKLQNRKNKKGRRGVRQWKKCVILSICHERANGGAFAVENCEHFPVLSVHEHEIQEQVKLQVSVN